MRSFELQAQVEKQLTAQLINKTRRAVAGCLEGGFT